MKKTIRLQINQLRKNLTQKAKEAFDNSIAETLTSLKEWENSNTILLYVSHNFEVNTMPLIKKYISEKNIIVPKTNKEEHTLSLHKIESLDDLEPGNYDILEPISHTTVVNPDDIDLAIIPGVAFDKTGHRIGYGKAYYDKLNRHLNCKKIGLAYNLQIVDNIPAEEHDERIDMLITENNTFHFNS